MDSNQAVRVWARQHGMRVSDRGRIPEQVTEAFNIEQRKRKVAEATAALPGPVSDDMILVWWMVNRPNSTATKPNMQIRAKYRDAHPDAVLEYDQRKR